MSTLDGLEEIPRRRHVIWLGLVVSFLCACGTDSPTEPPGPPVAIDQDVVMRLFAREYDDVDIQKVVIVSREARPRGGAYDVEFTGEGILKEDRLSQANSDDWYQECPGARSKYPPGDTPYVYRRTAAAGARVALRGVGVLVPEGTTWRLSGHRLDHLVDGHAVRGNAASVFADPVVIGTPRFADLCTTTVARD